MSTASTELGIPQPPKSAPERENPEDTVTATTHDTLPEKRRTAAAMALPFFFALVLPLVFVGLMHSPTPRHMDLDVVGYTAAATTAAQQLDLAAGAAVDLHRAESVDQARADVLHHDARAAYDPATGKLYVASAGGVSAKNAAVQLVTPIARAQHRTIAIDDLSPTAPKDPNGTSLLYLGMGAIISGLIAGMLVALLGNRMATWAQVVVVTGATAVFAGVEALYGWSIFNIFDGAAGKGWLTLLAISWVSAVVTWGGSKLIGPAMALVSIALLMFLGVTASGVSVPLDMAPVFYDWMHQVLPTARGISMLRDVVYFGQAGLHWDVAVMVLWGLLGLVAGVAADAMHVNHISGMVGAMGVDEVMAVTAAAA